MPTKHADRPPKLMRRCLVLCWLALSCASAFRPASAQRIDIAYYDVERLYDTIASPFYNDTDYTPEGRLHW
ncbi:MAG: hypothetical protein K2G58_03465, partial [Alistipes sp.]|nr:hypothetical protein [Alistipes sp.]